MRAYHRIIGDPPSRGFGSDISSVGFPGGNWATATTDRRLPPITGIPFFDAQFKSKEVLVETQSAYELQSLDFTHMSAVYSAEGMQSRNMQPYGRPHGYSHIVALAADGADNTTQGTPLDWLSFHGFLTLERFWAITPNETTYAISEWTPAALAYPQWERRLPNGFIEALMIRYWRSATARAFTASQYCTPIRLCLGNEKNGKMIIELGKAFLRDCLLKALPRAAYHTLSVSMPVPVKQIQKFEPTSLAILYPENILGNQDDTLFDVRNGFFVPLSPLESEFARQMINEGSFSEFDIMYKQCSSFVNTAPENTPFMADYDIAWTLFRICRDDMLSRSEMVVLWRHLHQFLCERHGLSPQQADSCLSVLERKWLDRLIGSDVPPTLDMPGMEFLLCKALRDRDETVSGKVLQLLLENQMAFRTPFFAEALSKENLITTVDERRLCAVAGTLLNKTCIDPPLTQEQLDVLYAPPFAGFCERNGIMRAVMEKFLIEFGDRRPDLTLFIMPLSLRYLDVTNVVRQVLERLIATAVHTLPGQSVCNGIRDVPNAFNDQNATLFNEYIVRCFCAHQQDIDAFVCLCKWTERDMTDPLRSILNLDTQAPCPVQIPMDNMMLNRLLHEVEPLILDKARVCEALYAYIGRMLEGADMSGENALAWLMHVDEDGVLLDRSTRLRLILEYYGQWQASFGSPPSDPAYQILMGVLAHSDDSARSSCEKQINRIKLMYDQLLAVQKGAVREQAIGLLPYFSSTIDTPELNKTHLEHLRKHLCDRWRKNECYFASINEQRSDWCKGNITPLELLDGNTKAAARELLSRTFGKALEPQQFCDALEQAQGEPPDGFADLWRKCLAEAFKRELGQMMLNTASLNAAKELEKQAKAIDESLVDDHAMKCLKVIVDAESLIRNRLPTLGGDDLYREARKHINQIIALGDTETAHHLQEMVFDDTLADGGCALGLSVQKRMMAGLILSARSDKLFSARLLLKILPSPCDRRNVFDADGYVLLSCIAALFRIARELKPSYPCVLKQALDNDPGYRSFAQELRRKPKKIDALMPWRTDLDMRKEVHPTSEYMEWLSEQKAIKRRLY